MNDGLVEFLRARLDEDEATALPFRYDSGDVDVWRCDEVGGTVRSVGEQPFGLPDAVAQGDVHAIAVHIARHDPARVLADVEAKRRILEWHESWPVLVDQPPTIDLPDASLGNLVARASQQIEWMTTQEYRARFGDEPPTAPVLLLLALPYAGHPDYREEWRP